MTSATLVSMVTLGQVALGQQLGNLQSVIDVPDPPPLDEGGGLARVGVVLFESPWVLAGAIALVAVISFFWFQHRAQLRRGLTALALGGAVAGGLGLLSSFVVTDREKMGQSANSLVGAVAGADVAGLRRVLTGDAKLYYLGQLDVDAILNRVEAQFASGNTYSVRDWAITRMQRQVESNGRGVMQIKVRVRPERMEMNHHSWWRLDMVKGDDGQFRVQGITPIAIQWDSAVR